MDLFDQQPIESKNLLPYDGTVNYYGPILSIKDADHYYSELLENIAWEADKAIMFGKLITTKRKVAWYADTQFSYTYSKITKTALPWSEALLELKAIVEEKSKETFNSCLLNLYHDGSEGMAWHSDGEKDLKRHGAIASLTLGAQRNFAFKHKVSKERITLPLAHGSLLIMKGTTQENWLHRLPPTKKKFRARVNLTFRTIEK